MLPNSLERPSSYGIASSHLDFPDREAVEGRAGSRVLHELDRRGTAGPALYRQGRCEFFLDRPDRHDAAFVVIAPPLQARLLPLLRDNVAVAVVDEPRYGTVAYASGQTCRQSNGRAVEAPATAAERGVASLREARPWMQTKGEEPTTPKLAFDDHRNDKRSADRIEAVTVDPVFAGLRRAGRVALTS